MISLRRFNNSFPLDSHVAYALTSCVLFVLMSQYAVTAETANNDSKGFIVTPTHAELNGKLSRLQLVASKDGHDLTRDSQYGSLTPETLGVNETGVVHPVSNGTGTIRVTHGKRSVEVTIDVANITETLSVSFRNDVIPILNRTGCTSGACHAAQYGQGGFKLSLLGYAPEQDHAPIVSDRTHRRLSRIRPEDSLFLQKPAQLTSHGGGQRFKVGSDEYQTLLDWIRSGAPGPVKDEPKVVDLIVEPRERVYRSGECQQLRVVAKFSDESLRDVTNQVMYDSMSEAVAKVSTSGYVESIGSGQTSIMIRYMGQAKISMVVVPFAANVDLSVFTPKNFVDELVLQRWERLGLQPTEVCSDQEFLRRAFLDAIGTLPKADRIREFFESDDPNKRERLVDELLGLTGDPNSDIYVNEWSAYWALKWGDLIRNNRNKLGDGGMWSLYNWTRASLRENKPVDQFVRELITAQGSVFESGPANYYKVTSKPDELAESTVQNFLGIRLQCAKCHHHPFEVYSQADYFGLAAFFTRVATKSSSDFGALGQDTVVLVKRTGSIRHPRTRQTMKPTPLGGEAIDESTVRDLRRPLAEWLTSPDNKLFARNIVNRFWGYLMGSGLVEPIDDMRATNPPSNPELLDALADDFVKNEFDLRKLMHAIMTSSVYQLSSRPRPENASDTRFYTQYNVRRVPAEVLLDAVDFACGTQEKFSGIPAGTRAIELPDPNFTSYFLDTLGRPKRVITCECERTVQPNLAQVLHIANGDLLQGKISNKNGRVANLLANKKTDDEIIANLYLATFSRPPTDDELTSCKQVIADAPNQKEGVEDVLWALCNSREFLFNH